MFHIYSKRRRGNVRSINIVFDGRLIVAREVESDDFQNMGREREKREDLVNTSG